MRHRHRFYVLGRAIAAVLLVVAATGCENESTPPPDPMLARVFLPDAAMRLPGDFAGYSIKKMRAVSATNKLLIVALIPREKGLTEVVLLCDPGLQQVQVLHRSEQPIHLIAASADGRYVAIRLGNWDATQHGESIELIDLQAPEMQKTLASGIEWGLGLGFSETGHLLVATDLHTMYLWNLDSKQSCAIPAMAAQVHVLDSIGRVVCDGGSVVELASWNERQCPAISLHSLPWYEGLAYDSKRKIAYGGVSIGYRFLGSGYKPAKVLTFDPVTGSINATSILPYPESEEPVEQLALVHDDLLMLAQERRIVLHDAASMKVRAVLLTRGGYVSNATYLPAEDAIYSSAQSQIMKWQLHGTPRSPSTALAAN